MPLWTQPSGFPRSSYSGAYLCVMARASAVHHKPSPDETTTPRIPGLSLGRCISRVSLASQPAQKMRLRPRMIGRSARVRSSKSIFGANRNFAIARQQPQPLVASLPVSRETAQVRYTVSCRTAALVYAFPLTLPSQLKLGLAVHSHHQSVQMNKDVMSRVASIH